MGGYRFVERDYVGPDVEDDDLRMSMAAKSKESLACAIKCVKYTPFFQCRERNKCTTSQFDVEKSVTDLTSGGQRPEGDEELRCDKDATILSSFDNGNEGRLSRPKQVSFLIDDATAVSLGEATTPGQSHPTDVSRDPSIFRSETPTVCHLSDEERNSHESSSQVTRIPRPTALPLHQRVKRALRPILRNLLLPPSITILASFLIAFITPLKALFTPVPGYSSIPNAPDGQPPLAFVLDTANFVGAASIPLGLICLGSALARLELPSVRSPADWARLPIAAISLLALGKMVLMPVLGVLIVNGFVSVGFIAREDKVLRFVCV